jgi:hypothetical protein
MATPTSCRPFSFPPHSKQAAEIPLGQTHVFTPKEPVRVIKYHNMQRYGAPEVQFNAVTTFVLDAEPRSFDL